MELLTGWILPAVLFGAGGYWGLRLRFFWIRHPLSTVRTLRESAAVGGTKPFAALTMALAGTLGVGNIAGVATAITAGGAGAVFWMLCGAMAAMSVKYCEVALAVRYRRTRTVHGKTEFYGGAMYYIRDGLTARAHSCAGRQVAAVLGGAFAVLCAVNALLTGNIIQVRAAAGCVPIEPLVFGCCFAAAVWLLTRRGTAFVAVVASVAIPALAALLIALSGMILIANAPDLPGIFQKIWQDAWNFRACAGGICGMGASRAIRYGVTRGIFSNEAGCGTAPTAHAAAHVRSPHHQGCYGIFEVFADTVLLCTMTALVILLYADGEGLDGMELSLTAYTRLAAEIGGDLLGTAANILLRISIVLFALATIVCQSCYGAEAVRYFSSARAPRFLYRLLYTAAVIAGSVIPTGLMWRWADGVVAVMTVINVFCLFALRRDVPDARWIQRQEATEKGLSLRSRNHRLPPAPDR